MKTCIKCGETKPLESFYRNHERKDGRLERCKDCVKVYEQSPERRAYLKKWQQTEAGKACIKRNKPSPEVQRERTKRYRSSPKGQEKEAEYMEQYIQNNPEQRKAMTAIMHALERGKIEKPDSCQVCNKKRKVQGHHESYEPEHWLDVIWLCASCHKKYHLGHITIPDYLLQKQE